MKSFNNGSKSMKLSKYELLKTSWIYQIKEFCNNSNLHGVRFIADREKPFYERFIWFAFIFLGVLLTLINTLSLWNKFQTQSTITSLDTDFHLFEVPFPAVTLCPNDPTDPVLVKDYIFNQWGKNINDQEKEYYEKFVTRLANLSYENIQNLSKYSRNSKLNNLNLKNLVAEVFKRCDKLLFDCEWQGIARDCCEMFIPVLTEYGFCYTFNSNITRFDFLDLIYWFYVTVPYSAIFFVLFFHLSFHTNNSRLQITRFFLFFSVIFLFIKRYEISVYRLKETKKVQITEVKYINEADNNFSIKVNAINVDKNPISVYLHSSNEKITLELLPHHVWSQNISKIFFDPKETYTSEDTRHLSINQRNCVFFDEINLVTNEIYTLSACTIQCRMNMASEKCGCIPFFYPKIDGYIYCNLNGLNCIHYYSKEIFNDFNCKCKLGCKNIVYEIEKIEEKQKDSLDTSIRISFVSWPSIRYKRELLFGWLHLFTEFGSVAGLFLGFSILSAVEIIYFFTLRVFCMTYKEQDKLMQLHNECKTTNKSESVLNVNRDFLKKFRKNRTSKTNAISEQFDGMYNQYLP